MRKWTERQEEIMEQAVLLVAENGIQGLTVRNLARRIGVSEPALYRHFDSKTDLLLEILDRFEHDSLERWAEPEGTDCPGVEHLDSILLSSLSYFQEHPEVSAVIFAEEIFQNEPRLTEKVSGIMRRNQASLHKWLTRGQECGKIRADIPVKGLGLLIQGAMRLLVSRWRMCEYGFDLVEEGRSLLTVLKTVLTNNK